jgi:CubicO group peptidase (beta-lactamase class C family)
MAKTITAMLIGIALAEGKIASIQDSASRYVPGLSESESTPAAPGLQRNQSGS